MRGRNDRRLVDGSERTRPGAALARDARLPESHTQANLAGPDKRRPNDLPQAMKRTHAERIARALAELDKPCKDEPSVPDITRYHTARTALLRARDHWGSRTP